MSPLPLTMTHLFVQQRHEELRTFARPRPRRTGRTRRLRCWARGWLDRFVPSSTR